MPRAVRAAATLRHIFSCIVVVVIIIIIVVHTKTNDTKIGIDWSALDRDIRLRQIRQPEDFSNNGLQVAKLLLPLPLSFRISRILYVASSSFCSSSGSGTCFSSGTCSFGSGGGISGTASVCIQRTRIRTVYSHSGSHPRSSSSSSCCSCVIKCNRSCFGCCRSCASCGRGSCGDSRCKLVRHTLFLAARRTKDQRRMFLQDAVQAIERDFEGCNGIPWNNTPPRRSDDLLRAIPWYEGALVGIP